MSKKRKIKYIGVEERIFPQFGQFKSGDEVEFNEPLLSTGLFTEIDKKDGDK